VANSNEIRGNRLPAVYFRYDMSPITMRFREEKQVRTGLRPSPPAAKSADVSLQPRPPRRALHTSSCRFAPSSAASSLCWVFCRPS
jgi:hypothetical protein